jgi:hypothetical protein
MMLTDRFAPIRWIGARFYSSTRSAQRGTIEHYPIPIDLVVFLELGQQPFENTLPDSAFLPSSQATPKNVAGRKIAGGR